MVGLPQRRRGSEPYTQWTCKAERERGEISSSSSFKSALLFIPSFKGEIELRSDDGVGGKYLLRHSFLSFDVETALLDQVHSVPSCVGRGPSALFPAYIFFFLSLSRKLKGKTPLTFKAEVDGVRERERERAFCFFRSSISLYDRRGRTRGQKQQQQSKY